MLVSCLCPTYGRFPDYAHLLNECVESFLRQDWPDKELIIFNDLTCQTIKCAAPGVRCVNMPQRYQSLGAKYNACILFAKGDILVGWEDDDISLPGRISQSVEKLSGYAYFNPQRSWYIDGKGLHKDHQHGVCHNASAFTRQAWQDAKGYPETSGPQDAQMDARLKNLNRTAPPLGDDPKTWQFIYRWGVSDRHLSGYGDKSEMIYRLWDRQPWPMGTFEIVPGWNQNYVAMTEAMS